MPVTITDDPTSFAAVTAPSASDLINVADIQTTAQKLADRTAGNKARLDAVAPGSGASPGGVSVLRHVATIAALEALTGAAKIEGGFCYVDNVGLYQYFAATDTNDPPFQIAATDGTGGWELSAFGALDIANGVPRLNGSARVDAAKVVNGIIATAGAVFGTVGSAYGTTTSTTYVDIGAGPAQVVLSSAAVGDVLMVRASVPFLAPSSAGGKLALTVTDSAGTNIVQEVSIPVNETATQTLLGRYVVTHSGTQTVKARYLSLSGAATQTANGVLSLDAMMIRP
jgi:hypothetical protein